ncbi:eukaryotic translation initiation factor 2 subunit beta-like [Papaver somniferum]|uniref:eukaryotic translation initiation factor 2 subunit beta-like n=1 Tax=Papaver somniferum TaxID=3469 RepID=UPI000E6FECE0|nr:eukaryotic translation initiation factor 2 subunit beta-like [Papaver somniferum]
MAKYEEFLDRMVNILRENNPEYEELLDGAVNVVQENIQKLVGDVLMPPKVQRGREGLNKTALVNFMDICKKMNREPEHVMNFLLTEMGTSGSLDGQQKLVVKGRFTHDIFDEFLKRYINDYVICNAET